MLNEIASLNPLKIDKVGVVKEGQTPTVIARNIDEPPKNDVSGLDDHFSASKLDQSDISLSQLAEVKSDANVIFYSQAKQKSFLPDLHGNTMEKF